MASDIVDELFTEEEVPSDLYFELYCRNISTSMVVAHATKRTVEAWCLGE